ncbi:DUF3305 domain-containing protein [Aquibaculum sediminis]|uniref:DUF3305 domain-containing protein n=1 Tax=Aquibaculum sediminis TaxID=3231907 RepID=UPI003456F567
MTDATEELKRIETLPLGVVLEQRRSKHPWQDYSWRPVDVLVGAPERDPRGEWLTLREEGEGEAALFHAGTLSLELHRKDTPELKMNLQQRQPLVYVVLRKGVDAGSRHPWVPLLVTANVMEAEFYSVSGEELVEGVPMPVPVHAFIEAFVAQHHVEVPFYKRKRKPHDPRKGGPPPGKGRAADVGTRPGKSGPSGNDQSGSEGDA